MPMISCGPTATGRCRWHGDEVGCGVDRRGERADADVHRSTDERCVGLGIDADVEYDERDELYSVWRMVR